MSDNHQLNRLPSKPITASARGTVDLERADSIAYLRANWDVLVKHSWLILSVAFILTALVTLYSFRLKPVYRASAVVQVEVEVPVIQALNDLFRNTTADDSSFISTQVGVLQSGTLAWQTIQQLGLAKLAEFGGFRSPNGVVGIPESARTS